MMRSLYSAVSGLQTHQTKMDVIGNNIANINTVGYKKSQITFQDVLSQLTKEASAPGTTVGGINPAQVGTGVMVGQIKPVHTQGAVSATGYATDVMIQGEGFFILEEGTNRYLTRAGAFCFDQSGDLVNSANGMYVLDSAGATINIPGINTVSNINITAYGEVKYIDAAGNSQTAATIGLAKVPNPAALKRSGENLYIVSDNSGPMPATPSVPGAGGTGVLIPMNLEMSNVDLSQEFTEMIITERGFQANSRTIRVSDEMLQEIINLKR